MEMIKKKLLTSLVELSDGEEDYMKVEQRRSEEYEGATRQHSVGKKIRKSFQRS